jgi:phage-related tail fiber protein
LPLPATTQPAAVTPQVSGITDTQPAAGSNTATNTSTEKTGAPANQHTPPATSARQPVSSQ